MSRRQRLQLVRGGIYALTIAALALLIISVDWGALGGALFKWDVVKKQFPDILTNALRNTIIFTIFGFIGRYAPFQKQALPLVCCHVH